MRSFFKKVMNMVIELKKYIFTIKTVILGHGTTNFRVDSEGL